MTDGSIMTDVLLAGMLSGLIGTMATTTTGAATATLIITADTTIPPTIAMCHPIEITLGNSFQWKAGPALFAGPLLGAM
jgi:hypothetical protein